MGMLEGKATERADQHIDHLGETQTQLVGAHGVSRGTVGVEIELALLDAVFHLAAGAIELFIEVASLVFLSCQRSDDKARIGLAASPFRLGDNSPFAAPAVAGPPGEVLEATGRSRGLLALLLGRGELALDLGVEARVLG